MRFRITLIAFLLVIVSIIVTLNFYFQRSYQAEMAEQINQQQIIHAKTLSMSIEKTLEHFMEEIVSLASLLSDRGLKADGLDKFIRHAFEELNDEIKVDVMLIGKGKKILFSSKKGYEINQEDMKICSLCISMDKGAYHIEPSKSDASTIKAISPIVDDSGRHLGAILIYIDVQGLNKNYLQPVMSGIKGGGSSWVMDGSGTLLYHPTMPEMEGRNIRNHDNECFECHKSFNAELAILDSRDVGFSSYVAPYGEDKLIAFSRIDAIDWIICLSIPYSEVTRSMKKSMALHSMLVLAIMFSTVFGAFFVIVINRARAKAEAKAVYVDKVRQYADELENIVNERTDELRSEKEKLDVLISSINAGIGIFDNEFKCVWTNDVLSRWLSPERSATATLMDFYTGSEGKDNSLMHDELVQEVQHMDLGKKKGFFQLALSPFNMPDGTSRILMLLQDVTDLKMAEEQMIQSDKLAALSRLSAGVAHEIGNPLTSIFSYVQILRDKDTDEFTGNALDTIYKHIGRIQSILRRMSSFTRGKEEESGKVKVGELVENTVELVRFDKRAKGIEIVVDIDPSLPSVQANGNQLVQVIMNMMLNAADSMTEGGRLDIIASQSGRWLELAFMDTGSGIEDEHIKKIFDPFFTTKKAGTGLGLPVCHSIIKLFGGEIDVISTLGKGTTFTVRLPIDEE